jgi:putative ABC transport system permease protein
MNKPAPKPPLVVQHLMRWFLAPHRLDELEGDLDELFQQRVQDVGLPQARWRYVRDVLSLMRPSLIKRESRDYTSYLFSPAMFRNYVKSAWRNLVNNRFYSLINMTGLTAGLAVGILILLWVQDELSFDRFHRNITRIYRLENWAGTGSSRQIWTSTVAPIAEMGKKELPELKETVRISENGMYNLFKYRNKSIKETHTSFADPSLFSVFDFPLIQGNPARPFTDSHSIVLTESTARRYFGLENPIGKVLTSDNNTAFTVSGVMQDIPKNSSIQADMILPIPLLFETMYNSRTDGKTKDNDFATFNYNTYFLLQPGVSLGTLTDKLRTIHLRNKPDDTDLTYLLQPLADMHLYRADGSEGGIETVRMFSIIALLILTIACINYVNLSTARSMLRSKEVSMRKIVGAARSQLFLQFIVETVLLFTFAAVLALVLIYALLPVYNQLSGKELTINFGDLRLWKVIGLAIFGTLLASSIYPALLLSSFDPLRALTGKVSARLSEGTFRKALVITQFAVSVILMVSTFIISNQLTYIRSKELGYDKTHIFGFFMRDNMRSHYEAVKADLTSQPGVAAVTRASSNIVQIGAQTGDNEWAGKENGETMFVRPVAIDKDFIPFFKMTLTQGANFNGAPADSTHFILNETAVKAARIENPIGKPFRLWKTKGTIVGVVKDFHFASMRQKIEPAVLYYDPNQMWAMYVKTTGQQATQAVATAQKAYKQYNGEYPFEYAFLDDSFNKLYQSEQNTGLLFTVFAAIAILISCLGLFGLATFTAQIRTREIGVRKVLGASVSSIIQLLARDFIKLVLAAVAIAVPVAWYTMSRWLSDFAYRTEIQWWIFALAGLLAVAIALLTVSFQSIRAALMDPVKSLRSE